MTPSTADDNLKTSNSALATAPPSGGAAKRTSTPTPVVALPPGGEAPAAPEGEKKFGAESAREAEVHRESGGRVETGGSEEAEGRMRVKEEMATAQEGDGMVDESKEEMRDRNVKGGEEEATEIAVEGVVLPHGTKRVGSQGMRRPDGTKRQGAQTLMTPSAEPDCSPIPDGTKRLGNGEGKGGGRTGGSGGRFEVLAEGEVVVEFMEVESEVELENYEEIEVDEVGERVDGGLNEDWVVVKGRQEKQRRNPNKVAEEGGAVLKERLAGKRVTRRKALKKKGPITIKPI